MLKLKVKDRSLCLLKVYAPDFVSKYQAFVDDVNDALQRVGLTESTILFGDFNTHFGTDGETWKCVILVGMKTQRLTRTGYIYCTLL